jgi:hypothetical protein
MGMFDETAIIDYRLSLAGQGKQTSVFRLQQTNGSLLFLLSICRKQTEVFIYICFDMAAFMYTVYICCRFRQET